MKRTKTLALVLAYTLISTTLTYAQHPYPQPRPMMPTVTTSSDGITTTVVTPEGQFPSVDPFANPPGSNFLQTVYSNIFTDAGVEMPNTLPSTETVPYNLIDGPVNVTPTNPISPRDDLIRVFEQVKLLAQLHVVDKNTIKFGIDVLEGNPIPSRPTYSGMALLHYTGPEKIKSVTPTLDASGKVVGGNVNIHQVWFDSHIESDTALLDPTTVQEVPWTITYTIDVLHRGADDFSPFTMYFSDPPANYRPGQFGMPHVAMDQTFYPMAEGTRVVMKIKMAPAKYYNLTYNWGWRIHPPRVQVTENALKTIGKNANGTPKTLVQWETETFGAAPRASRAAQLAAIAKIGELAPAKRMWKDLNDALTATPDGVVTLMQDALLSLDDWSDRTHLPRGVNRDPNADLTLFYVNNTIYGSGREDTAGGEFIKWTKRGTVYKATLLNGDHFKHGYISVDFGGTRGWENQFQHSGGSGCGFTFGRVHWWMNAGGPFGLIDIPPADATGSALGLHKVQITLNYEPSRRLRMYQFDPYHHDVAVYSLH